MDCIKSPSAPSTSELEAFDRIFDGNLTASNIEALDALFPDGGKGSSSNREDVGPPSRLHRCVDIGCFSFM